MYKMHLMTASYSIFNSTYFSSFVNVLWEGSESFWRSVRQSVRYAGKYAGEWASYVNGTGYLALILVQQFSFSCRWTLNRPEYPRATRYFRLELESKTFSFFASFISTSHDPWHEFFDSSTRTDFFFYVWKVQIRVSRCTEMCRKMRNKTTFLLFVNFYGLVLYPRDRE